MGVCVWRVKVGRKWKKGLMWFFLKFHTKSRDELEKNWKTLVFLPYSLTLLQMTTRGSSVLKAVYFSPNSIKTTMKMKKVKSLKKNPSWFGNMIKLSWIIAEIADSLLPSIICTKPAISNHNKHHWAQQLSAVLLTLSANQKMLSVFSLSFDSICLECESTSWTSLFHIHAGASSNDTLSFAFQKALTQQIPTPLDPDVKWTVFTSVTSDRHNMPSYGSRHRSLPKSTATTMAARKTGRTKVKVIYLGK